MNADMQKHNNDSEYTPIQEYSNAGEHVSI